MFGLALFHESTMSFVAATVVSWYASDWKVRVTLPVLGGVGAARRRTSGQRERRGDGAGNDDAQAGER